MSRFQIFHSKLAEFLKLTSRLLQQQAVRRKTTSEHLLEQRKDGPPVFKSQHQIAVETLSHMNFQPATSGDWSAEYGDRNMKRSKLLYASIAFLGITVYYLHVTECLYLHGMPPIPKKRCK